MTKGQAILKPGLYVVATPLGNLEDITFRALTVLREAQIIAAEDTRVTAVLLRAFDIQDKTLLSIHEHTTSSKIQQAVDAILRGSAVAYVTDAGTPGVSDPVSALVKAAHEAGISIFPVPGASAPAALLSVSGFRDTKFTFHGFFPRENAERVEFVSALDQEGGVHLFFESPHRIKETMSLLSGLQPEAKVVVGREMTKRYETFYRGSLQEVANTIEELDSKGEYTVALHWRRRIEDKTQLVENLVKDLCEFGVSQKILVKVAMSHGVSKNSAYSMALKFRKEN